MQRIACILAEFEMSILGLLVKKWNTEKHGWLSYHAEQRVSLYSLK